MSGVGNMPAAERLRRAAAGMLQNREDPDTRVELYRAIREALGDDLARWSRTELGFPMDADEVASALWAGLMTPGPNETWQVLYLASEDTLNPVAWLWARATRKPVGCSAGWLRRDGGHPLERAASDDALAEMGEEGSPDERELTPLPVVADLLLEALLQRTPEHLHDAVAAGVEWLVPQRIQWRDAKQYVLDLCSAVPDLEEEHARNLIGAVWGSKDRPDMSLFNLFRWDADARVVDHGPAYRSLATYMQLMHGLTKRRGSRSAA